VEFYNAVRRSDTGGDDAAAARVADAFQDLAGLQIPTMAAECEREVVRTLSEMLAN
jgi:hypothetical protein